MSHEYIAIPVASAGREYGDTLGAVAILNESFASVRGPAQIAWYPVTAVGHSQFITARVEAERGMGMERDVIVLLAPATNGQTRPAWSAVAREEFLGAEILRAPPYHLTGCTWVVDDTLLAYEVVATDSIGTSVLRSYREQGDSADDSLFRAPGYYRFDVGEARFRFVAAEDSALATRCHSENAR